MKRIRFHLGRKATLLAVACILGVHGARSDDFERWMNLGKAALENRNSKNAIEAFTSARRDRGDSAPAIRNLARAQMLARDFQKAVELLDSLRALEKAPLVATLYLSGLARAELSDYPSALPYFEEAVELDPHTSALRFQLANAYQMTGDQEKARRQFLETLRLDPLHATAHFRLAAFGRQEGDMDLFQKHHNEFMRLRQIFGDESRTPAMLARCVYTEPESVVPRAQPATPSIPVRFVDATADVFDREAPIPIGSAAILDRKNDRLQVFGRGRNGAGGIWSYSKDNGEFRHEAVRLTGADRIIPGRCSAANYYDPVPPGEKYNPALHAKNDVLILGSAQCQLLLRLDDAAFEDVTERSGLAGVGGSRAQWFDYDHDGDCDLAVAGSEGGRIFQNNGDGAFREVTSEIGIDASASAIDVAAVDLDSNIAIDLVFGTSNNGTIIFHNQKTGVFQARPDPPGPLPFSDRLLADDMDNDGHADLVLLDGDKVTLVNGQSASRITFDSGLDAIEDGLLFDYDNDGWLDLCLRGRTAETDESEAALAMFRNNGNGSWTETGEETQASEIKVQGEGEILAGDLDADGDVDLLAFERTPDASGCRFLRNEGGNAHGMLSLDLAGLKTNPTGIGTRVEIRAGAFWATRFIDRLPIEIGVGSYPALDSVRVVWTNGVQDNQTEVEAGGPVLRILEKNVATGSCPYLYAWDGTKFQFVTDLLGNSPVGLSVSRGQTLPADPEEIVKIGGPGSLALKDGRYLLEVTEELREILFLDEARLIAADHPEATETHSNDKLAPPPFEKSEIRQIGERVPLLKAMGGDGIDRTQALQTLGDGQFAEPGVRMPPPLRGLCRTLAITLEFEEFDANEPLVLALTGWLQYGDASVNIAISQNESLAMIPPRLEAETASGWRPVDVIVGVPAGKTKTILCDLEGRLPQDVRRLRLTSNLEIHWDRAALFKRIDSPMPRLTSIQPSAAVLYARGYSEIKTRKPGHPATPEHGVVRQSPPWTQTVQGWYTRYGDVAGLASRRDGRMIRMGGGDALRLEFEPGTLPSLPPGWTRSFFFYSIGWDKDGDYNVVEGDIVGNLPEEDSGAWSLEYQNRWIPARLNP